MVWSKHGTTLKGHTFRRTHNLEEIGEQCLQSMRRGAKWWTRQCRSANMLGSFRYPGEPATPSPDEVVAAARMVFEAA